MLMSLRMTKFVGVVVIVCCYLEFVKGKWEIILKKRIFPYPNHAIQELTLKRDCKALLV